MATSDSVLSFGLEGNSGYAFELGRKGFAGKIPRLTIHTHNYPNDVTLAILGYESFTQRLNLPLAIQSGLFDLFDMEDNTKVPVSTRDAELGYLIVEPKTRTLSPELMIDGREEFWNHVLTPGHSYEIRWHEGLNLPWAFSGEFYEDSSQLLSIRRYDSVLNFKVHNAESSPPHFSISLKPTANLCHLSGEPPFGFLLQLTSHADEVMTMNLNKSPLKEYHGLEDIAYVVNEDGQEAEFAWGIGCWEHDMLFPDNFNFDEFEPGVTYDRMFWLEKNNMDNELGDLEAGRTYTVSVSRKLISCLSSGRWGKKEELLAGSERERIKRWNNWESCAHTGSLLREISEPFQFETV
jgi:hypothetical protein